MSIRVFAPAKINLTLQVGRPRADGFHPLQSAVMFADVGDWIEAEPAAETSLWIAGPFAADLAPTASGNLVLGALEALKRACGTDLGAAASLEKNLPISSGIGGGSSDAATMLKALNVAWGLGYSQAQLMRIGAELGADVPVCVGARSAWMTGIGEILAPLDAPPLYAVLINPKKPLPTRHVFLEFDRLGLGREFAPAPPPVWRSPLDVWDAIARMGNDLEVPARTLMPDIAAIAALLGDDNRVRAKGLSGSGATMFALADSRAAAETLAADLSRARPDCWIAAATLGAA
jgi:4-diphosphocytidyl-2-C-methyl-D-erythritol kinase